MKKVIQVLAIVLLLSTVGSMTSSAASSDAAAKGFYSIEAGNERYVSINEFKKLNRADKIVILTGNYYLIANGSVFPIEA